MSKQYFGLLMHAWLSIFNAIFVTSIMMYINTGSLPIVPVLISILQAFIASFVAGLLVPAAPFGEKLAKKQFSCEKGTFLYLLISSIPVCLWMATVLSFLFAVLNIGFSSQLLLAVLNSIPLAFIISVVTTILFTPVALRLSNKLIK